MDNELRDDVISAAFDGERVDLDALRGALGTEEGRASLAAFVLLRAATAADDIAPRRQAEDLSAFSRRARPAWLFAGPRVPAAWAASIAILAIAASFWFGTTLRAPITALTLTVPPAALAPTFAPLIVAEPAGAIPGHRLPGGSLHAADLSRPTGTPEPPRPTRVLRFVPGVDWTSTPE